MELARAGKTLEARDAFLKGLQFAPEDKRFPVELAGLAFQRKDYDETARWLHRALAIDSKDSYSNDFLGTIHFLRGNLPAALQYWNRAGKPEIENVELDPRPQVNLSLLDSAFAFSPASRLTLPQLQTSETRVRGLSIFAGPQLQLKPREDGKFDLIFHAQERNGFGTWPEALASTFGGVFYQTITPQYFNFRRAAINAAALLRWDSEKRRALISVAGPIRSSAKLRYQFTVDLRNENWDLRDSFRGPAPLVGSFNLRRESFTAGVTSYTSGRWTWSSSAEFSHRDFRRTISGPALPASVLRDGNQLKYRGQLDAQLLSLPEQRLKVHGVFSPEVGRIWSRQGNTFGKLRGDVLLNWLPKTAGDDYEVQGRISGGGGLASIPLDELTMLGLERDNDLWLRAHIGTRDGRKGSAPLGKNYFLANWEFDKNIWSNGLMQVKLGPFFDTGKMADALQGERSRRWLFDIGAQAKLRALGTGVVFSYGKDLRSGNNAFYVTLERRADWAPLSF